MLEEIAKKNDLWLRIAYNICKDEDLAKDLVQEMYLSIYEQSQKRKDFEINDFYVTICIRNSFIDYIKKQNKTISLDYFHNLEYKNNEVSFSDEELNILKNISFLEKELILLSQEKSYRKIEEEYNINYQFARRVVLNAKEKYGKKKRK